MTIDASLDKRLSKVVRAHDKMRRNGVVHRVGQKLCATALHWNKLALS